MCKKRKGEGKEKERKKGKKEKEKEGKEKGGKGGSTRPTHLENEPVKWNHGGFSRMKHSAGRTVHSVLRDNLQTDSIKLRDNLDKERKEEV